MRLGQGGRGRQRQAGGSTREDARKRGHGSTVNTLVVVVKNFTIISAAPLLADVELSSQRDRSGDASVKMLVACGSVVVWVMKVSDASTRKDRRSLGLDGSPSSARAMAETKQSTPLSVVAAA